MAKVTKINSRKKATKPASTSQPAPVEQPAPQEETVKALTLYGHPDVVDYPSVNEGLAHYRNHEGHMVPMGDGHKTIFDPDTGRVFAPCVTEAYHLISHQDVIATVMAAALTLPEFGTPEPFVSLPREGARMRLEVKFPDVTYDIGPHTPGGKPDLINPSIVTFNSYDTGWALRTTFGAYRLVCSNGMTVGKIFAAQRKEHHQGIDIDQLRGLIVDGMSRFSEQIELWKVWAETKTTPAMVEQLLNGVSLSQGQLDRFKEMREVSGVEGAPRLQVVDFLDAQKQKKYLNLWRAYNLLTQFATHEVSSDILRERMMGKIETSMERVLRAA